MGGGWRVEGVGLKMGRGGYTKLNKKSFLGFSDRVLYFPWFFGIQNRIRVKSTQETKSERYGAQKLKLAGESRWKLIFSIPLFIFFVFPLKASNSAPPAPHSHPPGDLPR